MKVIVVEKDAREDRYIVGIHLDEASLLAERPEMRITVEPDGESTYWNQIQGPDCLYGTWIPISGLETE